MTAYIKFIMILFCVFCKAQNNFIVYNKIIDDAGGNEKIYEKNILVFEDKWSIFFSYRGSLEEVNDFLTNSEKIRSSQIIKNILDEKKFYIKDNSFTKDVLFTLDNYQKIDWNIIQKDEEIILGYKCHKALGKFRGRDFIAYFTTDLPVDLGPLKFRGLPGVILKVSDKDNLFTYEAAKIVLNFPQKIDINSKLLFSFPEEKSSYIDYKEYINIENNYLKDIKSKVEANRPAGTIVVSSSKERDFKIEKSFEWEESKKP